MFNVIAVILGVAAIVVYVKGVRYDQSWGAPLMTVLVLGAVIAVVLPFTPLYRQRVQRGPSYHQLTMIGEKLGENLSPGANVLIIRQREEDVIDLEETLPLEERVAEQTSEMKKALEAGTGFDVNIVASLAYGEGKDPRDIVASPNDPEAFNSLLNPYRNQNIDLVVSLIGLPIYDRAGPTYDLEELDFLYWDSPPMFAADERTRYNPDMLRRYIQDNLLNAVIVATTTLSSDAPQGRAIIVGADNLEEMPDAHPYAR